MSNGQQDKQLPAQQQPATTGALKTAEIVDESSQGALVLANWEQIKDFATVMYQSQFFEDVKNAQQGVAKLVIGREMGMSPAESLTSLYIIRGQARVYGRDLAAKFKSHRHYGYEVREWDDDKCTIVITWDGKPIPDSDRFPTTFTYEQAKAMPGKDGRSIADKPSWKFDRRQQLFYKALSRAQVAYAGDIYKNPVHLVEDADVNYDADATVVNAPEPRAKISRGAKNKSSQTAAESSERSEQQSEQEPEDVTEVTDAVSYEPGEPPTSHTIPAQPSAQQSQDLDLDRLISPQEIEAGLAALAPKGWTKGLLIAQVKQPLEKLSVGQWCDLIAWADDNKPGK